MTLLLDYITNSGIDLVQAYLEIDNISWNKRDGLEVKFSFNIYKNKEAFDAGLEKALSDSYSFIYNMTSGIDIVTQCYTYIKSLDRFTSIVDLMDGC